MIVYNEKLKKEITDEMARIALAYTKPGGEWWLSAAEEYYNKLHGVLGDMMYFPLEVTIE